MKTDLLFLLSITISTLLITKTNAECSTCDPCIGRPDTNFIQCPNEDCLTYVQCSNEKTVNSFSCINGLTIFDVSTQTCNFAFQDAVQVLTCGDDPACNTPEDPSDNPDCPDIGGSVCDTPCAGKEAGMYQVPGTNRQQYVNCFNGDGVVQTCGTDLVFDSVLKVCNLKASATCGDDPECNTPEDPSDNPDCPDIGGSVCDTPCAGKEAGMYQVPGTNRQQYVNCFNGDGVVQTCGTDLVFDSVLKVCNLKASATCGDDPECNTPEDPSDNPDCPDIGGSVCDTPCAGKEAGMYQVPGTNRQQYVNCFNGDGVVQTCGTDLVFDSVLKVCNLKASATCGDDPECNTPEDPSDNPDCPDIGGSVCDTPCAGKEAGMYQVPGTNRQQYVNCFNGDGVVQTCGDGFVFDSVLKVCNFVASATCGDDPECTAPEQPEQLSAEARKANLFRLGEPTLDGVVSSSSFVDAATKKITCVMLLMIIQLLR